MKNLIFAIISIIFFMFYSCRKQENYSVIPKITNKQLRYFKNVEVTKTAINQDTIYDSVLTRRISLTFSILDGDGDIGLKDNDTNELKMNDLFILIKVPLNDSFVTPKELINPEAPYRLPYLVSYKETDFIKAEVQLKMDFPFKLFSYDTIQCNYYIYDRANHKSNIETIISYFEE